LLEDLERWKSVDAAKEVIRESGGKKNENT